jgi:hypothetical protein
MQACSLRRLAASLLLAGAATAQVSYFTASLDGAQEVPPNASSGGGYGIVRLEEPANTVRIFVNYAGLTAPATAAHLHLAPAGVNGGIIVNLNPVGTDVFQGNGVLTAAQVTALKTAGTYVNVHNAPFPGGEIRGQVVESTSTRLTGVLSGAQEVPPNASTATGTAVAFLHQPDNRIVYDIESTGLVNVLAAHFHAAPAGVNGPIVVTLNGANGHYCGVSQRLSAAQVATLLADGYYVNIHTAALPGGEVRAQMLRDRGDHFVAAIDGASEVPPNPSAGQGSAVLTIDAAGTASIRAPFGGLASAVLAAHIHNAPPGVNGPIVVPLTQVGSEFQATFVPTAGDLAQLRAGTWYVNIHTAAFPGGEIRGQLRPARLPTTFGPSCPGTAGRPEIGATGFPGLGSSMTIDLYGAAPGVLAVHAFGLDRDVAFGATPLPLAFTTVGLNAPCFFLLDPASTSVQFADAHGCAAQTLALPLIPAIRGLPLFGQWFVFDAGANPAGLVASNGLSMVVQ